MERLVCVGDECGGRHTEGSFGALLVAFSADASLSQTLTTTAGNFYVITFDYLPVSGTGSIQASGTSLLASQTLASDGSGAFQHGSLSFVADSSSTLVSVTLSSVNRAAELAVDNFSGMPGKYSHPGRFTGGVRVTTAVPGQTLTSAHIENIVARIAANGQLFMVLQPSGTTVEGFIVDSKAAAVGALSGTATSVGTAIRLTLQESRPPKSAGNPSSQALTLTNFYLLVRAGN